MEEKNLLIEKHMADLRKLYPTQLLISKKQLAQLRENSESSLNREKENGTGIPYKQEGRSMVMYPLRNIAAWMAGTPYRATDTELLINKHIEDIWELFPNKLLLSKSQLAQLRGVDESTLNREKKKGKGVPFKKDGIPVLYAVRDIAEWLAKTIKTIDNYKKSGTATYASIYQKGM